MPATARLSQAEAEAEDRMQPVSHMDSRTPLLPKACISRKLDQKQSCTQTQALQYIECRLPKQHLNYCLKCMPLN